MKNYFKVKNWDSFQHYKDRNPPWIKLHNHLLDNYEFECLPDASKAHLLCIWMLASRTQNKMPMDPDWIKRKIGASSKVNLKILVDYGFIEPNQQLQEPEQDASNPLDLEEESREEKSREDAVSVLNYLNQVFSSKYKATTSSHIENIRARLSDGHSVEDLKAVIDCKFKEWHKDEKMAQYLRPQTLFQSGKFQGYLIAARAAKGSVGQTSGYKPAKGFGE